MGVFAGTTSWGRGDASIPAHPPLRPRPYAVGDRLARDGAMLAPIRLTNAAAQLPSGSGETQGDASPPISTLLPQIAGGILIHLRFGQKASTSISFFTCRSTMLWTLYAWRRL